MFQRLFLGKYEMLTIAENGDKILFYGERYKMSLFLRWLRTYTTSFRIYMYES